MTHLVLVAGGLGSRLAPMTNHIPKFLVNIGKNTGYVEQIRYWRYNVILESITVIVHSAYKDLVQAYHDLYFPKLKIIIKTVDVSNGSAHAIFESCHHLHDKSVLFSWCDVLPNTTSSSFEDLFEYSSYGTIVFTNYDGACRYRLNNGVPELDPLNRGGIFGLYYVGNFSAEKVSKIPRIDGQDFVEVLHHFAPISEFEIESIIDFGDIPKLQRVRAKSDEAREFNSIEFINDDFVLKAATNEQGRQLIAKETSWYETVDLWVSKNKVERPAVPNVWIKPDKSSFFLERIKGQSIWKEWDGLSVEDRNFVLRRVVEERRKIFNLHTFNQKAETVLDDVKTEALNKLISRFDEIEKVIDGFGKIDSVNGYSLKFEPRATIKRLWQILNSYYSQRNNIYGLVHGDLQFSNSMVNTDDLSIAIIDPRGYFGQTKLYGLEDYDIGKMLYALSGYDKFNYSKDFGIEIKNNDIRFKIPKLDVDGLDLFFKEHFKPIHRAWLAVCWIGLAQYIKNDPVKSVAAHYHGMYLAHLLLEEPEIW